MPLAERSSVKSTLPADSRFLCAARFGMTKERVLYFRGATFSMPGNPENPKAVDLHDLDRLIHSGGPLSGALIRQCMADPSLEVQGYVFNFVMNEPDVAIRVVPSLSFQDFQSFIPGYLSRCIIENPAQDDDRMSDSQFDACRLLMRWFQDMWTNPAVPQSGRIDAKHLIEKLYREGNEQTRYNLIHNGLEHLFENHAVREYFSDWATGDPVLQEAYAEASEWTLRGGSNLLWPRDCNHAKE
jgi:hypothetical protein